MRKRKFSPEFKMAVVLEGLKEETPIEEICRRHQISSALYFRWRKQFLEGGLKALSGKNGEPPEVKELKAKIKELERIIGKQTVHLEILKKICQNEE